jgi:hypothetical protein
MTRETADRLDNKSFQHPDVSAKLSVSVEDMHAFFKTERSSYSNQSKPAQFLDMGTADSLYGSSGTASPFSERSSHTARTHNKVEHRVDPRNGVKDFEDWAKQHEGQEGYFWHSPQKHDMDPGFDQVNNENGGVFDPDFHINYPKRQILTPKEAEKYY